MTQRVASQAPGMVKVGDELWRATLPADAVSADEPRPALKLVDA